MKIKELLTETFLIEMPHLRLGGDRAVDLELEVHSNMEPDDYVDYIKDWVYGRPIKSKTPKLIMQVEPEFIEPLIEKLLANEFFKGFTRKYYGLATWERIQEMLLARLKELR